MPASDTHPEYDIIATTLKKMRDCATGQLAVHDAGTTYLPMLDGQKPTQYEAYKRRALFLAATSKTIESLAGAVFRKPPEIEAPEAMGGWLEDMTASGVSAEQLCRNGLEEVLTVGRFGLLVDYPSTPTEGMTVADVEAGGIRPRVKQYSAENIINWDTTTVGNKEIMSLVVLKEEIKDPIDEFDTKNTTTQYRVLDLNEGRYRQRVFDEGGILDPEQTIEPTMGGNAMDYIPFILVNAYGEGVDVGMPPLNDLADINISHYQLVASYRNGLHYTGVPVAIVTGATKEETKDKLQLGSSVAWAFGNPETRVYYLEFEGKGLGQTKEELDTLESNMAAFGARLLREAKKAAEAAETAQINRSSESSLLASWAGIIGSAVAKSLEIMRDWAGVSGDVEVRLNKDYMPVAMDAQTMTALLNMLQAGRISFDTFWSNLLRGEIAPEGRTSEEELDLIELAGPVMDDELE